MLRVLSEVMNEKDFRSEAAVANERATVAAIVKMILVEVIVMKLIGNLYKLAMPSNLI